MNLVIGAPGVLGSQICRRLTARGKAVQALARPSAHPAILEPLRHAGVTFVHGDLKEPATLELACRGVTAVISTASSTFAGQPADSIASVDQQGQLNLIEAARTTGVQHFIFISFPPMAEDFPLQRSTRAIERRLVDSGLTYTIWQPTFFMEVWLGPALGFDIAHASARIYGTGHNKLSWISYLDVAEFAVIAVDHAAARNVVVPLGGPEVLSPLEVVGICEGFGGPRFHLERVSEQALRAQKAAATDPLSESLAGLMLGCAAGQAIDMRSTLKTFPVRLTSVREYAQRILASL